MIARNINVVTFTVHDGHYPTGILKAAEVSRTSEHAHGRLASTKDFYMISGIQGFQMIFSSRF